MQNSISTPNLRAEVKAGVFVMVMVLCSLRSVLVLSPSDKRCCIKTSETAQDNFEALSSFLIFLRFTIVPLSSRSPGAITKETEEPRGLRVTPILSEFPGYVKRFCWKTEESWTGQ